MLDIFTFQTFQKSVRRYKIELPTYLLQFFFASYGEQET